MKNKELEEQLRLVAAGREFGRQDMVPGHVKGRECLVLGDSIIQSLQLNVQIRRLSALQASEWNGYRELLKTET